MVGLHEKPRDAAGGDCRLVVCRHRTEEWQAGRSRAAISDDATICFLQDVLVMPDERRGGVGRALVQAILERYREVRQKVLLTDDEPGQRSFYESLGYAEVRDHGTGSLRAFVRFDG